MSLAAQIVIALVLALAGFAGGVKYHAGVIAQRDLAEQQQAARERGVQIQRIDRAAVGHEADKAQIRTEFVTITQEVERVVEKPFYRAPDPASADAGAAAGLCLDDDGLRQLRAATGQAPDRREPAPALPSPEPTR